MILFCDTSALMKLLVDEAQSDQMRQISTTVDAIGVRKDLVRQYSRPYPVPNYVVEFLLSRYCASSDPAELEEGLQLVEKQLQGRTRAHRRRGAVQRPLP